MTEPPLHPKLIQANIAFFKGERAETLRLLDEYQQETPHPPAAAQSMALWLSAHTQTDHDSHMAQLSALAQMPHEDTYTQTAREYLRLEDDYHHKLHPPRKRGRGRGLLLMLLLVGLLIGVGALIRGGRPQPAPEAEALAQAEANGLTSSPTPTPFPDKSRELPPLAYSARYEGGILQVAAVEIGSERVIRGGTGDVVQPVAGAHFFALRLIFECRSGVCNTPPEAALALELSNTDLISARPDVVIAGQAPFEPIALGRTTSGWVIFEIPLVGVVNGLHITPTAQGSDPVSIPIKLAENP